MRGVKVMEKMSQRFMHTKLNNPYMVVSAGHHQLTKTRVIDNHLNPVWRRIFYLPVTHYTESLVFTVMDSDASLTNHLSLIP